MVDGSNGHRMPTNVSRRCWLAAASVVCGVLAAIAVTTTMADPNTGTGRVVVFQALKNEPNGSDQPGRKGFEAPAAGARFGPPPPDDGLEGTVTIADPIHACSPITAAEGTMAIALIKRGGPNDTTCLFDTKVMHAQNAGFIGVIVFDNVTEGSLAFMESSGQIQIDIPSVFVSNGNGLMIADLVNRSASADPPEMLVAQLYPDYVLVHAFLFTFVTIVAGTSIVFTLFLFYRRHMMLSRRSRRRIMSHRRVAQLPSRSFEEGDAGESCCICLDQYKSGDTLTILPCNHLFHKACIMPWLVEQNRVCPICKQDPQQLLDDRSAAERGEANCTDASSDCERQPLLGPLTRTSSSATDRIAHAPSDDVATAAAVAPRAAATTGQLSINTDDADALA